MDLTGQRQQQAEPGVGQVPADRPFSPVSTMSLSLSAGYMNMSTPLAVAWTHRSFGEASSRRWGARRG
ncbi:MAG: hypothetical protein R2749_19095 [Acidimicrobiales bacterium]